MMSDKSTTVETKFKSYYTKTEVDSMSQYLSSSISKLETSISRTLSEKGSAPVSNGIVQIDAIATDKGYSPGIYYISGMKVPNIYSGNTWGLVILFPYYSTQLVIIQEGKMFIRNRIGNPLTWREWHVFNYNLLGDIIEIQ